MLRRVSKKTVLEITEEWDLLAGVRLEQILSGRDITYNRVIVPSTLELVPSGHDIENVLDAGCGVGVLTSKLAQNFKQVVGVDPSSGSIKLARTLYGSVAVFVEESMEHYAEYCRDQFDLVVASMVLMDVLRLEDFVQAVRRVLRPGGVFVFSLTHPCFWPSYYGYVNEPWFRYTDEIIIEAPFKISSDGSGSLKSTHVHRSLSCYIGHLDRAALSLEAITEPMPAAETEILYPSPWDYPRYLFGRCHLDK